MSSFLQPALPRTALLASVALGAALILLGCTTQAPAEPHEPSATSTPAAEYADLPADLSADQVCALLPDQTAATLLEADVTSVTAGSHQVDCTPPGDDDDPVVVPGGPGEDTPPAEESAAPSPGAATTAADAAVVEAAADAGAVEAATDAANGADVAANDPEALASTGPHAQSALLVAISTFLLALGLVSVRASHRNRAGRGSNT